MIIPQTTSVTRLNRRSDFGDQILRIITVYERRLPLFHLWVEHGMENSQEITNNGKLTHLTIIYENKITFRKKM